MAEGGGPSGALVTAAPLDGAGAGAEADGAAGAAEAADAAGGHEGPDGRRLVGPVDAVNRLAEIKRARSERVGLAASHEARQIRLTHDHLFGRGPVGPFRHPCDPFG